jgi:Zn-dependent protease with chaperone function
VGTRWRTPWTWAWACEVTTAGFAAELADGRSAALVPVQVMVEGDGLHIRPLRDGPPLLWPLRGLQVEDLGRGLLHLQHSTVAAGAVLSSRDAGLMAALRAAGVAPAGLPRGGALLRLGAIYAGALAVVVGGAYAAVSPLSRVLARRVPLQVEQQLGGQAEALFASSVCPGQELRAALDHLAKRLARPESEGPGARSVQVVNWDLVNAFTLPGGKVLLTRGLIEAAQGPDEIAGVLAHELEHVRLRHVMSAVIRSSVLSFGWAVTVGDFSGLMILDPSTMFSIANQGFSRSDERAADQGAVARLDAAAIDRRGFAGFFQRMAKQADLVPGWLSSHPSTQERLAGLKGGAAAHTTSALSESDWKALKAGCAGRPPLRDPLRQLLRRN